MSELGDIVRIRLVVPWLLGLALAAAAGPVVVRRVGQDYHLENHRVRLVLAAVSGGYAETLYAATDTGWQPLLAGTGAGGETLRLRYDLKDVRPVYTSVAILMQPAGAGLELIAHAGPHRIRGRETTGCDDVFDGAFEGVSDGVVAARPCWAHAGSGLGVLGPLSGSFGAAM